MYLNPITVDSVTYNFTEESLKELIKSETSTKLRLESVSLEAQEAYRKIATLRGKVYDFFSEAFDDVQMKQQLIVTMLTNCLNQSVQMYLLQPGQQL